MEANWKPLEAKLGALRCAGFMFMGDRMGLISTNTESAGATCSLTTRRGPTNPRGGMSFERSPSRRLWGGWKHH